MKKFLKAFILILSLLLVGCSNQFPTKPHVESNSFVNNIKNETVEVQAFYYYSKSNYGTDYGTGVIVYSDNKNTYILTDSHVVQDAYKSQCNLYFGDDAYLAKIILLNSNIDLALLKTEIKIDGYHSIKMNYHNYPPLGTIVYSYGFPAIIDNGLTVGHIYSYPYDNKRLTIRASIVDNSGGSGSGLFNSKGQFIGIFQKIYLDNGKKMNMCSYMSSYEIAKWLRENGYEFIIK